MKGVADSDEAPENYHLNLQLQSITPHLVHSQQAAVNKLVNIVEYLKESDISLRTW